MTPPSEDADAEATREPADVYEQMVPLEPYTTGELADGADASRSLVRRLLAALADAGKVRRKEPEPERVIWIREPPNTECPGCGREFVVRFAHPVFRAAQFCPDCGTALG